MPRALLVVVLLLIAPLAAPDATELAPLGEGERIVIRDIISRQIDAFRRDDGVAAFAFASPTIRGMFGTPERFMTMVRSNYRPVYRPRTVRFEELLTIEGKTMQRVVLVGPEQEVVIALYEMQRQPNGEWRINGCFLFEAEDKAT